MRPEPQPTFRVPLGVRGILLLLSSALFLMGCKPPTSKSERASAGRLDPLVEPDGPSPFEDISSKAPDVPSPADTPAPAPAVKVVESKQFPKPWMLTSADGRSTEGLILAKAGEEIAFRRTSDAREFVIPIAGPAAA